MTWMIAHRLVVAVLAWSVSIPAAADTIACGPYGLVTSMLAEQFQEKREAIGLSVSGMLMELFTSESGSWTVLLTSPQGIACIIASGDSFETVRTPPPEA